MSMIPAVVASFVGLIVEPFQESARHGPQTLAGYVRGTRPLYTDQLKAHAEGALMKPGHRPVEWGYNAFLVFRVMEHNEMLLVIGDGPLPDQTFLFVEGLSLQQVRPGDVVYLEQVFKILPEKKALPRLSDGYNKHFSAGQLRCWVAALVSGRESPAVTPLLGLADLRVGQFGRLGEGQYRVKAVDQGTLRVDESRFAGCRHFVIEGVPLEGLKAGMVISLPYVFRVVGAKGKEHHPDTHEDTLILKPLLSADRLVPPYLVRK